LKTQELNQNLVMSIFNSVNTQNGRGSLHLSTVRGMKDGRYHLDRGNSRSSERGKLAIRIKEGNPTSSPL